MNPYYAQLLESMPDDLDRTVFRILAGHVGQRNPITRARLAVEAMGSATPTTDRQVRRSIEVLGGRRVPVLADSGRPGYYLAETREEIEACLCDMVSRHAALGETIRQLRQAMLPAQYERPAEGVQERLWA